MVDSALSDYTFVSSHPLPWSLKRLSGPVTSRRQSGANFVLRMAGMGLCAYSFIEITPDIWAWQPVSRGSRPFSSSWYRSYYDIKQKCPDWSHLYDDEEKFHHQGGGLHQDDLKRHSSIPTLRTRYFIVVRRDAPLRQHDGSRRLNLHVALSPVDCEKYTYCWRQ